MHETAHVLCQKIPQDDVADEFNMIGVKSRRTRMWLRRVFLNALGFEGTPQGFERALQSST